MDPMVGSGRGGKKSHTHSSVMGGVSPEEENSNSNVVSLLEVCFLCNRRFLYDLTLEPTTAQDGLKEEDVILHMFFEDTSALEKSLLQCCSFCKTLCNSLLNAKSTLSDLIDEISTLLRKSKRLSTSASYLLSKPRVVTRLFQDQQPNPPHITYLSGSLGNLSSTMQIQLDTDYNNCSSNSGFPSQFIQLGNSNTSLEALGESNNVSKLDENAITSPILKESSNQSSPNSANTTSFSFLSPSRSSKKLKVDSFTPQNPSKPKSLPKVKTHSKRNKQQTSTNTSSCPDISGDVNQTTPVLISPNRKTVMVSNSSGRFVVVQEQEENARDVEEDHANASDIHQGADYNQTYIIFESCLDKSDGVQQQKEFVHNKEKDLGVTVNQDNQEQLVNATRSKPKRGGGTGGKFACTICPKSFKCNRDLQSHIGSHSQSKPFSCEICGTSYRQKKALDIHLGIHRGESKFECDHCRKVFTQKVALLRHLPLHTGEMVYKCDLCDKGFLHHSSFAHHKLTHSGQRNFQCRICDQYFFTSSHLKRHYRTHSGERPYQCNICDKTFNEKSNLKVHQRVHTKIAAFPCTECAKGFDRKNKLKAHLLTEHPQPIQENQEEVQIDFHVT